MKINFKKIATVLGSAILVGSTLGMAAAANYPAPFNQEASAIVVGSAAAPQDVVAAANIASGLSSATTTASATSGVTVSGEGVALDSGSTKIYLNTSLNVVKSTLTKTDLPTVLGETTFSGNVDSKITSTITVGSNKVTFAKQPTSSSDPVIGIALGSSQTAPLYNVSINMPAINFTDADSKGETIHLFGKDYVVSTATTYDKLILFSSAQEVTLTAGGTNPKPTANVTVDGKSYDVELVTGSGTTSATISVNGESKQITAGQSKKIGGIDIAVKSTTESTALNTITATILVGANKLSFSNTSQVTQGSDDDPIDGTYVYFNGYANAMQGLTVAVFAPDSTNDAVLEGQSFVDPVFGSFKVDFSGLNAPLNSSARDTIKVDRSGDKAMSLTFTDSDKNTKTFDFAYNNSGVTVLRDTNGYTFNLVEGSRLFQNNYTFIGNEDYGHLLQLTRIYNSSSSDYSDDKVTFKDVISSDTYNADATSEGSARLTIDGRQYTITYLGSGETGNITIKYPTSDSSATQYVVFPTIETSKGALVSLYEPQTITLASQGGFLIPDGDGYTTLTATYLGGNASYANWTLGSGTLRSGVYYQNNASTVVDGLNYTFVGGATTANLTTLYLKSPASGGDLINGTAVVVRENKNQSTSYNAIVIPLETDSAGTSTDPLGIGTLGFTSQYFTATLQSDSDITQDVDLWGTLVTEDSNTASQKIVTLSYPQEQVFANVIVGATSATTSGGSSGTSGVGAVTVFDNEVDSVKAKNLIVVGGSCINTVAASLLGSSTPLCGADFTTKTGVGNGQFLVQVFNSPYASGKVAMLVAGYEAADTTKAATYVTTNTVSTAVGTVVKKTSATYADVA
jgi:hypothetical protein